LRSAGLTEADGRDADIAMQLRGSGSGLIKILTIDGLVAIARSL
jgi:hypothetical protein